LPRSLSSIDNSGSLKENDGMPRGCQVSCEKAGTKRNRSRSLIGLGPKISLHLVLGISILKNKLQKQTYKELARKTILQPDCVFFIHLL
jgi:hypothetical protein